MIAILRALDISSPVICELVQADKKTLDALLANEASKLEAELARKQVALQLIEQTCWATRSIRYKVENSIVYPIDHTVLQAMVQPQIEYVIYDMDGLLLDTEPFYTEVTQRIVGRYGKIFDWSIKANMIGRPAIESARYLIAALALPITPEQYLEEREQLLIERFPGAAAKPGARALVGRLHQQGISQAVATSSTRFFFELKTQRHEEWFELFDCIVTGDDPDVRQGKPAPDIFLAAAQRLGADPANCLVFEDAPSGVEAALAAGMTVVAVPDPEMDRTACTEAHEVLASLEEFSPDRWGL